MYMSMMPWISMTCSRFRAVPSVWVRFKFHEYAVSPEDSVKCPWPITDGPGTMKVSRLPCGSSQICEVCDLASEMRGGCPISRRSRVCEAQSLPIASAFNCAIIRSPIHHSALSRRRQTCCIDTSIHPVEGRKMDRTLEQDLPMTCGDGTPSPDPRVTRARTAAPEVGRRCGIVSTNI